MRLGKPDYFDAALITRITSRFVDDDGTRYEMRDGGWVEVDGEDWSEDEEGGEAGEGGEGAEEGGDIPGKGAVAGEPAGAAKEKEKKRKKKKKKTNDKWSEKAANEHNWV